MATIAYGIHPVREILKNREWRIVEIHTQSAMSGRKPLQEIIAAATQRGIPLKISDEHGLRKLARSGVHQGVVAVLEGIPYASVDDVIRFWRTSGRKATVLVLDGVLDTQNLGALVRTACCAGCHGIILPKDRSASLTPAAIKASAGAVAHIPVALVTNLVSALDTLRKAGIWIAGTAAHTGADLYHTDLNMDLALVMGGEEKGLRPLVRKKCDLMVRIPMVGKISSLNVSVAAGVILFEILRQRQAGRVST